MVQLFAQTIARPNSAKQAQRAEEQGWAGLSFVDSQNLSGDVYVAMASAASATERLQLCTGVTNPITRHPAVTAGAIASIQALSAGRAALGIGRGDSSLAHLGRGPARVGDFERYLQALQGYLRGEELPFDQLDFGETSAPPVEELELAATARTSTIAWLPNRHAKVSVEVAATGPKVIAAAARHADRILFALGADPERIEWGMSVARSARSDAGLDLDTLSFGSYVNLGCLTDLDDARSLVRGGLSTFARFAIMHGEVVGPASDEQTDVMQQLHDSYDMRSHTRADSAQALVLSDEFVDSYAIVGPPEVCLQRISELSDLGLDKFVVVSATTGSNRDLAAEADSLLATEVLGNL